MLHLTCSKVLGDLQLLPFSGAICSSAKCTGTSPGMLIHSLSDLLVVRQLPNCTSQRVCCIVYLDNPRSCKVKLQIARMQGNLAISNPFQITSHPSVGPLIGIQVTNAATHPIKTKGLKALQSLLAKQMVPCPPFDLLKSRGSSITLFQHQWRHLSPYRRSQEMQVLHGARRLHSMCLDSTSMRSSGPICRMRKNQTHEEESENE